MSPCCARREAQKLRAEDDLRRIAKRAAKTPDNPKWKIQIAAAKTIVAEARQNVVDHEAEHAGE